jgi:two-component system, NarL family, nitrate/nitrite response regulator NarL
MRFNVKRQPEYRIVIVDDHPLTRKGIKAALEDGGFDVVGEGGSAADALDLCRSLKPAIIILDINMPGDGVQAAMEIARLYPAVKILMLTVFDNLASVKSSLKAGASGYVLKGIDGDELLAIVRRVASGSKHVSPELAAKILLEDDSVARHRNDNRNEDLNERENQILDLLSNGASNRDIGVALDLSETTVKQYTSRLFKKLGVKNRTEAALLGRK